MQFIWKISQKHAILHMSAASHLAGNIGQLLDPGTFGTGVSENELLLITAYRANNDESPHCCAGVVSSRSHHHHHHQHQQDDRLGSVFEDPGVVLSI